MIYEVNTWVWLHELGASLAGVAPEAWDDVALPGVDAVWLMGVWERSPLGVAIAEQNESLLTSFREALPDVEPDDDVGSPYCIRRYVVDERLGGPDGLAAARAELARRGVRLVLDFVPNHLAPDHPWTTEHPERFIGGTVDDLEHRPGEYLELSGNVIALGRDPYFAPWPDVVQLNAFDAGMRAATVDALVDIGDQCDGVRCDMAMLLLNDVFAQTWGDRAGPAPSEDFWPHVIPAVRARHPEMLFIAEAYWDLESVLQEHGFDHCYDKRLYDRLEHDDASSVREHLRADPGYQRGLVRFIENHDEPRAAHVFSDPALRAAAVAVATLPGATLWHEGQLEGRRTRLPVFLRRRPDEPADESLRTFYRVLLADIGAAGMLRGEWQMLETSGWADNDSHRELVAWSWADGGRRHVVVVNLSGRRAQAQVHLPWSDLAGRQVRLAEELLDRTAYEREGDELVDHGLYVDLDAWGWHALGVER